MTILCLDQFSDLGGAQLNLLELLSPLRREGWRVEVALPGEGRLTPMLAARGVAVHRLSLGVYSHGRKKVSDGLRFLMDLPRLSEEISRLAVRTGADLLYINGPRLMPALALAPVRLPVVFHAHNRVGMASGRPLVRLAVSRTRASVIAASRFVAADYASARLVYNGVPGPNGVQGRDPDGSLLRIGMIGRIAPQKRQKEFIGAAARLQSEWPRTRFVLCGDAAFGEMAALDYKRELLSLAPANVDYLGWRDDVYDVLASLDLLVMPSGEEGGVPRVVLEAFASRVPVLACASGAVTEVVADGVNGFLIRDGTAEAISRRLRQLASGREHLRAVASRAYLDWRERFQMSHFTQHICSIVRECASGKP